jgi:L1 cell adhesion molecule like protein
MVKDAERLKEEDEKNLKRVDAKNKLESYIYNWRNQMDNKELTGKLDETDVSTINNTVKDVQDWLDANMSATTEEFEAKMKECEGVFNPFASKLYSGGGMPSASPMPTASPMPSASDTPDGEEVD